jgi:hypothetical protein
MTKITDRYFTLMFPSVGIFLSRHTIQLFVFVTDKYKLYRMEDTDKSSKKHIESDPLIISDLFEGYPLNYFK